MVGRGECDVVLEEAGKFSSEGRGKLGSSVRDHLMQPASEPAGESARVRGKSDKCGMEVRLARVTTGRVGISSSSSR